MKGILDFELASESLERAKVDLAVAGLFSDELPLRGGAGRVDWRLCGLVSEQIEAGRMSGRRDEALLIPSSGQMRAQRVMVLGLGARSEYRLQQVAESVCQAVSRAVQLAAASLAMAPLGMAGDELPRCVEAILAGAREGFREAPESMRLRIVLPQEEVNRSAAALDRALEALAEPRLRFRRPVAASRSPGRDPLEPASPYRTGR
ncbi:MAG: hypothetical protein GY944_19200 [bacterium]|nr:hypothetical protein [bacterium]MCP5043158.1 hypothetical protein [bacterium]